MAGVPSAALCITVDVLLSKDLRLKYPQQWRLLVRGQYVAISQLL